VERDTDLRDRKVAEDRHVNRQRNNRKGRTLDTMVGSFETRVLATVAVVVDDRMLPRYRLRNVDGGSIPSNRKDSEVEVVDIRNDGEMDMRMDGSKEACEILLDVVLDDVASENLA
jgi:hypothetical protein